MDPVGYLLFMPGLWLGKHRYSPGSSTLSNRYPQ